MTDQISWERRQKSVNHVWDLAQQRNTSLKLWSKTDEKMTFHWGEQEWRKKHAKVSKSVTESSCNCGVRYWTNYKTRVSSTDVTVTVWEEGKPTLAKLKDVTQAGCRQQQEEAVPYNTIHSLCLCTPPEHITPSSLHTISPCTQPEEQSSREHGGEPCHGFSLAGTGSSLLCLTGLGCFLPSLQPQGPKAQSRQWAPWWHQHQQQGEHSPSGDLQAFQIGQDRYRTELQRFGQWGWLIWAAKIIWCYSSWNGSFTQKVQNTENKGKEKTWEGSGSWYSKVLRSPSIQLDW